MPVWGLVHLMTYSLHNVLDLVMKDRSVNHELAFVCSR